MKRWFGRGLLAVLALLVVLAGVSYLVNRRLPEHSSPVDRLSAAEKAQLAEFYQVRRQVGAAVWPGWDTAVIPVILYNEEYAFLVGTADPADGWIKVPQGISRGGPWLAVPDDTFAGETYYRQALPASGETPQAFTVRVGEQWAASMTTKEWMAISLRQQFQRDFPPFLAAIVPYPIVTNLFIRGSDGFVSLIAHESFHAFQGTVAPQRLKAAETAAQLSESRYPWQDEALQADWQTELDLLAAALEAKTDMERLKLAQQFLTQRVMRRSRANLDSDLATYEQEREWLEGLARYVELEVWRQASLAETYEPVPALLDDRDFAAYAGFDKRWSQEVAQMGRMADDEGDGRFYYSGMAQAVLLDHLLPGWKAQAFDEGVHLEDLLETAVAHNQDISAD